MKHYGPHWETPTYPEVGDRGQVGYWDAEVVSVHAQDETVTIEIFDEDEGSRLVEMPFVID